jgi:hypothetical protein
MAEARGGAMMKMSNPQAEKLLEEIRSSRPWGDVWLKTPHALLGGESPEQKIISGDLESVRNLFESILYIGIT